MMSKLKMTDALSRDSTAFAAGKLPSQDSIDFWNHLTDTSDTDNWIGGQPPKNLDGYRDFVDARDEWLAAGASLQKQTKEILTDQGFARFMADLMGPLVKAELQLLIDAGTAFIDPKTLKDPLAWIANLLDSKDGIQAISLYNYVQALQDLGSGRSASRLRIVELLNRAYKLKYYQMLNKYTDMVTMNARDKDGNKWKDGEGHDTPCPDDQAVVSNIQTVERSLTDYFQNLGVNAGTILH